MSTSPFLTPLPIKYYVVYDVYELTEAGNQILVSKGWHIVIVDDPITDGDHIRLAESMCLDIARDEYPGAVNEVWKCFITSITRLQ